MIVPRFSQRLSGIYQRVFSRPHTVTLLSYLTRSHQSKLEILWCLIYNQCFDLGIVNNYCTQLLYSFHALINFSTAITKFSRSPNIFTTPLCAEYYFDFLIDFRHSVPAESVRL